MVSANRFMSSSTSLSRDTICGSRSRTSTMKRGGRGGWCRRDRPFLVSVNRYILKNCSVNRDCSTLRET